ncbi:MAG TPA: VOC family protein [Allosphingosinicella sp.]|jgi:catechol 2,3-dioxygenase-like lactoylglutathione lyase family enzyme
MFSHITIGTNDLDRAVRFYDAVLAPLGLQRGHSPWPSWAMWRRPGEYYPMLWVGQPFDGAAASTGNGWMAAFLAETRGAVDEAYAAALAAGGTDDGAPGLRSWRPDYYGAYVRDPDGNKIHFVWRSEEYRGRPPVGEPPSGASPDSRD